jgi:putative endonuclease
MASHSNKHEQSFLRLLVANRRNGALYIGVTSDLPCHIWQHRHKEALGFTARYGVDMLVYFETCESAESAIQREKQLKKWSRTWKLRLIEEKNPDWRDMYDEIV